MPVNRVHALRERAKWPTIELSTTYCGKSGTQDRHSNSEFITMDGREERFEIATGGEKPTCKRCLAALSSHHREVP